MFFVVENVTMPDVLVAAGARAGWNYKGDLGQFELHDDRSHLARIHLDGFLPTQFSRIRSDGGCGVGGDAVGVEHVAIGIHEGLARQDLRINKVEVDRVRIHGQVGDLPDFGGTGNGGLGGGGFVRPRVISAIIRVQWVYIVIHR